ncbi:OmpA family protein [Vibrio sp. ZSDE26]|uniref:OmpA family protein n=1 Tax=Vibrio amylolyticus TaxID=2847292 RepID=A0A9X1XI20_9VIBR|nr:flagellar motor protein MotB [Vibrio amylolyticus]MCK6263339.1 OmpA family protein [Vibrio amylolyticus]
MRSQSEQIIIRRARRRHSEEVSKGSWKVAFADFTLAMMAFFMVMWILQVTTSDEKERIVGKLAGQPQMIPIEEQFVDNSLFAIDFGGSALPDLLSVNPSNPRHLGNSLTINVKDGDGSNFGGIGTERLSLVAGRYDSQEQMVVLGEFMNAYSDHLSIGDHVQIEVVPQGLRILVNDDKKRPMFKLGGSSLTDYFEDLLLALAPVFTTVENAIMISGHADATAFNSRSRNNNWNLSGQRAQRAREVLEFGGMPADRVSQVTAMSDKMLLDEENPNSAVNRRIEILVLTADSEEMLNELFGRKSGSALNQAHQTAQDNQPVVW